jgi:single-stranded DNA-binding protein
MNHCTFLGIIYPTFNKEIIEVEVTKGGLEIVNFQLSITEKRVLSNGSKISHTNYLPCILFGKKAIAFANFFKKKDKVLIEAVCKQETYENKEGKKVSKITFLVKNFYFTKPYEEGQNKGVNNNAGNDSETQPDCEYGW